MRWMTWESNSDEVLTVLTLEQPENNMAEKTWALQSSLDVLISVILELVVGDHLLPLILYSSLNWVWRPSWRNLITKRLTKIQLCIKKNKILFSLARGTFSKKKYLKLSQFESRIYKNAQKGRVLYRLILYCRILNGKFLFLVKASRFPNFILRFKIRAPFLLYLSKPWAFLN